VFVLFSTHASYKNQQIHIERKKNVDILPSLSYRRRIGVDCTAVSHIPHCGDAITSPAGDVDVNTGDAHL
jgi:hypothetical protein